MGERPPRRAVWTAPVRANPNHEDIDNLYDGTPSQTLEIHGFQRVRTNRISGKMALFPKVSRKNRCRPLRTRDHEDHPS